MWRREIHHSMSTTIFFKLSLYFSISIKNLLLQFQALALFPNPDIDERKALSGCLPSGKGREEREELVEQRHALHSAGATRGQDEACWRRLELPQEVFEDSNTVCTVSSFPTLLTIACIPLHLTQPEQDVPLSMDPVVRNCSRCSA